MSIHGSYSIDPFAKKCAEQFECLRLFRAFFEPITPLRPRSVSPRPRHAAASGYFFLKLRPLFRALPRACPVPHPKRCSARRLTCHSAAAHRGPLRSPPRFRPRSSRGRRRASRRCRRLSLTPATLRRARLRRLRLPFSPLPLRGSGRLRYATPSARGSALRPAAARPRRSAPTAAWLSASGRRGFPLVAPSSTRAYARACMICAYVVIMILGG